MCESGYLLTEVALFLYGPLVQGSDTLPNSRIPDEREPLPPMPPGDGVCNARRVRKRGYCPSRFVMANGRCAVHGGKTPKIMSVVAKSHKSEYLPPQVYARFESLNGTVLDNIEESIKIQQAMETSIIERLNSGESAIAWDKLGDMLASVSLIDDGEPDGPRAEDEIVFLSRRVSQLEAVIESSRRLVLEGSRSFAIQSQIRKELQMAHESQRKLTETLTKCRKEMQETYTEEQWNMLLLAVLTSLKRNVDTAALTNVVKDFDSFQTQKLLKAA